MNETITMSSCNALPSPTNQPFVSMFRIAGVPILPPLMTPQRRHEMRRFKEKAIKFERILEARRNGIELLNEDLDDISEEIDDQTSRVQAQSEYNAYAMLANLLEQQKEDMQFSKYSTESLASGTSSKTLPAEEKPKKTRCILPKLEKSETIIYDNRQNAIIMPVEKEENDCKVVEQMREVNNNSNVNIIEVVSETIAEKPQSLTLNKPIPLICVDPPTPMLAVGNEICKQPDRISSDQSLRTFEDWGLSLESSSEDFNEANQRNHRKKATNATENYKRVCDDLKAFAMGGPQRSATTSSLNNLMGSLSSPCNLSISTIEPNTELELPLVRSSSFTLEEPSKALLDHMRQQGTPMTNQSPPLKQRSSPLCVGRDTVESRAKRVEKAEIKVNRGLHTNCNEVPKSPGGGHHGCCYPTSHFRNNNYVSPYSAKARRQLDTKATIKPRPTNVRNIKKIASSTSLVVKNVKSKVSVPNVEEEKDKNVTNGKPKTVENDHINNIEELHRKKFKELLEQQKEEQNRLRQAFEEQQRLLFREMRNKANIVATSMTPSPPPTPPSPDVEMSLSSCRFVSVTKEVSPRGHPIARVTSPGASKCTARFTPRRQLFTNEANSPKRPTTARRDRGEYRDANSAEHDYRVEAATTINAYVRGYLVRRLFHTEQIQRLVQTIRDTMIFVLNLHLETVENPEEANMPVNIKLKARLLQQLASATRSLHLVFFRTTIKERMEIIARDRKRAKTKLLSNSLKRSPLTTTPR